MHRVTRIYALKDPTGLIRYIGKTVKPLRLRLMAHLSDARRGIQGYKNNWVRSLLKQGFTPGMCELEIAVGDGCKEEKAWIAFMREVLDSSLVNVTDGGEGTPGLIRTAEHRANLSKALKGKRNSPETIAKIKAARALQTTPAHNTPHSEETKAKIRERLAEPIIREKIGAANRGKTRRIESVEKMRLGQRKTWSCPARRIEQSKKVRSWLTRITPEQRAAIKSKVLSYWTQERRDERAQQVRSHNAKRDTNR